MRVVQDAGEGRGEQASAVLLPLVDGPVVERGLFGAVVVRGVGVVLVVELMQPAGLCPECVEAGAGTPDGAELVVDGCPFFGELPAFVLESLLRPPVVERPFLGRPVRLSLIHI